MRFLKALSSSFVLHLALALVAIYVITQAPKVSSRSEVIIDLANATSSVKPHFDHVHAPTHQHSDDEPSVKKEEGRSDNPNPPPENSGPAHNSGTDSGKAADPGLVQVYLQSVINNLQSKKKYPQKALDQEMEGLVEIEVIIKSDGSLEDAKILKPSPFDLLNQSALETVKASAPFPPPPNQREFHFVIPLRYHLRK